VLIRIEHGEGEESGDDEKEDENEEEEAELELELELASDVLSVNVHTTSHAFPSMVNACLRVV
jgi:hypothetical protein